MSRESRVYLGDQLNSSLYALAVRFARVQFPVAEVLIHVPHTAAAARGDAAQQWRTRLAQANCGQPAIGDQFTEAGDVGLQPLNHHRTRLVFDAKAQPEHPLAARL